MPENSTPRSNLITGSVLVIALAAVFFVGRSLGDDSSDAAATPAATTSSTETFGVVTGGESTVSGTPDQLTFTASVHNSGSSSAIAMRKTNHDVRAIVITAKNNGVEAKDIKTLSISVRPEYDYRYRVGGKPRIVSYTAQESVKILVRKLTNAGKTIGGVTKAAGNAVSIEGISLSISNRDELVARARASAVKKSKAAAKALAEAAGRKVGELEYVEEVVPQRYSGYNEFAAKGMLSRDVAAQVARGDSVPINPGKQQISVTVKVRWSLAG